MALTGRFNFRKTWTGRIVLQVEYEAPGLWGRLRGKTTHRRHWRDAGVMDLAAPELRSLVDLRFRPRFLPPAEAVSHDWSKAMPQLEAVPPPVLDYGTYEEAERNPVTH